MAVSCSFSSPQISLQKHCLISSPITKSFMIKKHTQVPLCKKKKSDLLQVRSFNNKVFENKSEGIICYRDENGEIICEGFDEGPRLLHQSLRPTYNSRDSEIVNLLHQRLLQIVNGGQLNNSGNGVATVQEE
ncbi:uncharacterized protein [Euphorbia lathyris]|uniref:uncharacterized protein n=1 Tax=Euphorbia lathyris TaxID=212925 RepID=UPI003313B5CB